MSTAIFNQLIQPLVNQLQNGIIPWHHTPMPYWGFARNYATDKTYTGFNWAALNLSSDNHTSPWFLTEKQVHHLGGKIKPQAVPLLMGIIEQKANLFHNTH